MTKEIFIEKARLKHGTKYDYRLLPEIIIAEKYKIKIICDKHGTFEQLAQSHLQRSGCPKCASDRQKQSCSIYNQESFIDAVSNRFHKLDFSNTVYKNMATRISYVCPKHGECFCFPPAMLKGDGCGKCHFENLYIAREDWIKRFREKHGEKYDYSLLPDIIRSEKHVLIICPVHGQFSQIPAVHKNSGCDRCAKSRPWSERQKKNHKPNKNGGWEFSKWQKAGLKSKYYTGFKIYIIECYDENERFFKIGKTFCDIDRRFGYSGHLPYEFNVIKTIKSDDAEYISRLELELKSQHKDFKYKPLKFFEGAGECFSTILNLNDIK